jgi:hypothetical protein
MEILTLNSFVENTSSRPTGGALDGNKNFNVFSHI